MSPPLQSSPSLPFPLFPHVRLRQLEAKRHNHTSSRARSAIEQKKMRFVFLCHTCLRELQTNLLGFFKFGEGMARLQRFGSVVFKDVAAFIFFSRFVFELSSHGCFLRFLSFPYRFWKPKSSRGGKEAMKMIAEGAKKEMEMIVGGGKEQGLNF
ncbi:hypothetical protein SLEP1_g36294 [Rubroshorea leprosula]|uniref:Uncharacterized protein n=1 Tax=Rubroshorea leprosula TaxID=152421 RepID=A0AAV5KR16_9ROSI|nr:hypothetical protein SLEP1_g36294 [Rubroshorea leprosula]